MLQRVMVTVDLNGQPFTDVMALLRSAGLDIKSTNSHFNQAVGMVDTDGLVALSTLTPVLSVAFDRFVG